MLCGTQLQIQADNLQSPTQSFVDRYDIPTETLIDRRDPFMRNSQLRNVERPLQKLRIHLLNRRGLGCLKHPTSSITQLPLPIP